LGDQRPSDAFLCGSIKNKPYFQLAVSSFDGELTLSVNLLGSDSDRDRIQSLFDQIEDELPKWELLQRAPLQVDRDQEQEAVQIP
jgi:NRPS condensation-like uncharacterized protein